jgi:hypothetical protein
VLVTASFVLLTIAVSSMASRSQTFHFSILETLLREFRMSYGAFRHMPATGSSAHTKGVAL